MSPKLQINSVVLVGGGEASGVDVPLLVGASQPAVLRSCLGKWKSIPALKLSTPSVEEKLLGWAKVTASYPGGLCLFKHGFPRGACCHSELGFSVPAFARSHLNLSARRAL